jgi:hypothetical protein
MRKKKAKLRVIVRPWTPRKIPYAISIEHVNRIMQEAKPKIKAVIYVGWARRKMNEKRMLLYLAATGNTASEARKAFKTSENFGEDIWLIE